MIKKRVIVTSLNQELLIRFQGRAPLCYEILPCFMAHEVDEAILTYKPHLIVEIQPAGCILTHVALRHPHIPLVQLTAESLELGASALEDILKQSFMTLAAVVPEIPLLGNSPALQKVLRLIQKTAPTEVAILLTGENGTGKELAAKMIHRLSNVKDGAMVPVNCASISPSLAESELFGCVKGAYTDAVAHPGYISVAHGGTLFLDEIGELSLEVQAKFLRLLENHDYRQVGSARVEKTQFRLVSATNADLPWLIRQKRFREDLYHRIKVIEIHLPALRDRLEDLPVLIAHFLTKLKATSEVRLSTPALKKLSAYQWPGNVRELRNALERALLLAESTELQPEDFDLNESNPS